MPTTEMELSSTWTGFLSCAVVVAGLLTGLVGDASCLGEIIYAVNSGGDGHTDSNGIHFQRDPLKIGTESDFGKQLLVGRVSPADMILYQTERYHTASFGYEIPIKEEGDYVLVLKFCEVYFTASNMKVFHVVLNNEITVISDLDIYDKVGRGIAYDEIVPFSISKGKLKLNGGEIQFNGILKVDFIKGPKDNPKINAIYVMKGEEDDVPKLPPLEAEEELFNKEEHQESQSESTSSKNRRPSGPRNPDPYSLDESSTMLPIFVAIVAFIPILFCLCKL